MQWHCGFSFAVRDVDQSLALKLVYSRRAITKSLGKISVSTAGITEEPHVVQLSLEVRKLLKAFIFNLCVQKSPKKVKVVKVQAVMMYNRNDAIHFAKKYSVITSAFTKFPHLNSIYYTTKGINALHPSFKVVLQKANYFPGEVSNRVIAKIYL